ncbi:hypothetical protein NEOLEDRAFT_1150007 [Neolentinus lepideus HHB14362 ss-1]|uniref:Uncharacterized protein n=1 Tax=Neolentinus lepideus HHB14362 ss-1 TaxID=1314782 RepID=A0A165QIR9_9AGAM|nr:hypothetical protein NEOLEDRAFT_1150007 [Neolentinus lepideus HHB14362 ss-1]
MPSTPSPSKPTRLPELSPTNPVISTSHEIPEGQMGKRGLKNKKSRTARSSEYDEVLDPVEYTKKLEGLLPKSKQHMKRTVAGNTRGRRQASTRTTRGTCGNETDSEDEPLSKSKRGYKSRGKHKATGIQGKGEIDSEHVEGRQERLAYFQKLDGYELQKENVYVV